MRFHQKPFPLPNDLFHLDPDFGETPVYAYLMYRENRKDYICVVSCREIGAAVGMSKNTVSKFVAKLEACASMRELVRQMENTICDSPVIEEQMLRLSCEMETVSGKKVYGYLKKPLKEQVDAIVDELAKVPAVAECYEVRNSVGEL